jgi:tRNA-dihydrouridine synthase A
VHARKAWLDGLSPKQNREIPPLDYDRVYRLKASWPELTIVINGGIEELDVAARHLEHVDGVMMGRAAYQTPYILAEVDRRFFAATVPVPPRADVLERLIPHVERHLAAGGRLNNVARHVLGLYHGQPHARAFRRHLSELAVKDGAGVEVLLEALAIAEPGRRLMAAAE